MLHPKMGMSEHDLISQPTYYRIKRKHLTAFTYYGKKEIYISDSHFDIAGELGGAVV